MQYLKRGSYSIRWRILCACVSLVAIGLGMAGMVIQMIYQEAQISSAQANGEVLVDQIAENISRRAEEYGGIILREVQNTGLFEQYINSKNNQEYFIRKTMAGIANRQNITGIPIVDIYACGKNGRWYYFNYEEQSTHGASKVVTDYVEECWDEIPRGAQWTCFEEKTDTVYMMRRIFSTSDLEDAGVVVIGISKSVFEDQFRPLEEKEHVHILILYGEEILFGDNADIPFEQILSEAEQGKILTELGKERYLVCRQKAGDGLWSAAYITGEEELFRPIRKMQKTILLTCILTTAGAFLVSLMISRRLTESIRTLCAFIERLENGEWQQKAPVCHDELGAVSEAFNDLTIHLHDTVENLAQQKLQTEQAEYRALQAEYHALQAAINPHFIFNAMESINAAAKLEGQNKIASACTSLGRLMRVAINRQKATVTLEEEMRYIRDYLEIQRFMMGDRLEVEFDLEPQADHCMVPSLLLQPLVENAVVHGVEGMGEGAVIYVSSEIVFSEDGEEELLIKISDNGIGMSEEALQRYSDFTLEEQEESHFGILSVEKRIKILYGSRYGISLSSGEGVGTVVWVRLPMEQSKKESGEGKTDDEKSDRCGR